jgi:DNA-binding CsgD family transcriptional regulator
MSETLAAIELTPMEREIVRCTLSRLSRLETARQLRLSEHAVQENLQNIYEKLGVASPLELLLCIYSGATRADRVAAA